MYSQRHCVIDRGLVSFNSCQLIQFKMCQKYNIYREICITYCFLFFLCESLWRITHMSLFSFSPNVFLSSDPSAPPTFTDTPPQYVEAKEGGSITLTCTAFGNPKPSVSWLREASLMVSSAKYKVGLRHVQTDNDNINNRTIMIPVQHNIRWV